MAGGWARRDCLASDYERLQLGKVRAELENYQQFVALAEEIAEVSEAICEALLVPAHAGPDRQAGQVAAALETGISPLTTRCHTPHGPMSSLTVLSGGRTADKRSKGPTAMTGDQAPDLHKLGSGGGI